MWKLAEEVRWQHQRGDRFFVYQGQEGFEANEVAIRVLELCRQPQKKKRIVEKLLEEYNADRELVEADVNRIIVEFQKIGIIEEIKDE